MPKTVLTEEVQVLRFFENGPIEKVEAVFHIVAEKVAQRLRGNSTDPEAIQRSSRRRQKDVARVLEEAEPTHEQS